MSFSRHFTKCEHEKYRHFAAISRVFVVFYNVNTVRSEMWVWDFPNHSSSTRDLENTILTFPPHSILSLLKTTITQIWHFFLKNLSNCCKVCTWVLLSFCKVCTLREYCEEDMWVLCFPHHKCWKSLSNHESKTSDLEGLFWHEWCGKLNNHISDLTVFTLLKNTTRKLG